MVGSFRWLPLEVLNQLFFFYSASALCSLDCDELQGIAYSLALTGTQTNFVKPLSKGHTFNVTLCDRGVVVGGGMEFCFIFDYSYRFFSSIEE